MRLRNKIYRSKESQKKLTRGDRDKVIKIERSMTERQKADTKSTIYTPVGKTKKRRDRTIAT